MRYTNKDDPRRPTADRVSVIFDEFHEDFNADLELLFLEIPMF